MGYLRWLDGQSSTGHDLGFSNVHIEDGAEIDEGVIFDGVRIGSKVRLRRVIADRYNVIPESAETGFKSEEDRKQYQTIKSGIVILPRG